MSNQQLHLLNTVNGLDKCLHALSPNAHLLLFEEGVYCGIHESDPAEKLQATTKTLTLYALESDLQSRGLTAEMMIPSIQLIDYSGFVKLTEQYPSVCAWS